MTLRTDLEREFTLDPGWKWFVVPAVVVINIAVIISDSAEIRRSDPLCAEAA